MSGTNYPSNSIAAKGKEPKAEKPKAEQVVKSATQRKKPLGRKIAETFTGDDAQTVGQYILFEVIVPAAKNMLFDSITQGAERSLFGEIRRARANAPGGSSRVSGYTGYSKISTPHPGGRAFEADGPRQLSKRARTNHEFQEIILETRGEAEMLLENMGNYIDQYDLVTVNDLYDMAGITGSYTDEKYGWFDMRGADVRRIRNGYILNLPPTVAID